MLHRSDQSPEESGDPSPLKIKSGTVAASANRPASISPNSNLPTNVEAPREYLLLPCQEGLEDVDKGDGYADGVW